MCVLQQQWLLCAWYRFTAVLLIKCTVYNRRKPDERA